jgi:hypothetical protein
VFEFSNGSKIILSEADWQPSDPDYTRFNGLLYTGAWIDEADELLDRAITKIIERVGRWNNAKYGIKGKVLLTFNPNKNYVYHNLYKP